MGQIVPVQIVKENPIELIGLKLGYVFTPQWENSVQFSFTANVRYTFAEPTKVYYKKYDLKIVGDILIKRGNDNVNTFSWTRERINDAVYNMPLNVGDNLFNGMSYWRFAPCFTNWKHKAAGRRSPIVVRSVAGPRATNDIMHAEVWNYIQHFPACVTQDTLAKAMNDAYTDKIVAELQRLDDIQTSIDKQRKMIQTHSFNNALRSYVIKG